MRRRAARTAGPRPAWRGALAFAALACAAPALTGCGVGGPSADPAHVADVEAWQADRDASLRGGESWLTLVALHFLEPGTTTFGSAPDNDLVLPASAPARAGRLVLDGTRVTMEVDESAEVSIGGRAVSRATLRSAEESGGPDVVQIGSIRLYVIERGGRRAVRVKDSESPVRTGFAGLDYFPVNGRFRVAGTMSPHDPPRKIAIPNVLGTEEMTDSPGVVSFDLDGTRHELIPVASGSQLFFIFRDETAGKETYGAGRFLYADAPGEDGRVVLDFNKAYNPPCAFTPYATCPLPPRENWLTARIEAGEKSFGDH